MPSFLKCIPIGSHGKTPIQKKVWKLVSDYVRIRDWYKYKGISVTGQYIQHWKEGDAGHFIGWTTCNNVFKFDVRNIHLQQSNSNRLSSMADGERFAKTINERYGQNYTDFLHSENNKLHGGKLNDYDLIEYAKEIIEKMKELPEQPEYFNIVLQRLAKE